MVRSCDKLGLGHGLICVPMPFYMLICTYDYVNITILVLVTHLFILVTFDNNLMRGRIYAVFSTVANVARDLDHLLWNYSIINWA
jgi:hypothetical protein